MYKVMSYIAFICILTAPICAIQVNSFTSWQKICQQLPKKVSLPVPSAITLKQFHSTLDAFQSLYKNIYMDDLWYNKKSPFNDTSRLEQHHAFCPYVEKKVINQRSKVIFFADLHGNIHSFMRSIKKLQETGLLNEHGVISQPNTYIIFLGDYVDRGTFGIEVLYTLMLLKIANPKHVMIVRGNHEDCQINKHHGFEKELQERFSGITHHQLNAIYSLYDYLPVALFLGCKEESTTNMIQCCHGGLEVGCNLQNFLASPAACTYAWIENIQRKDQILELPVNFKQEILTHIPADEIINFTPEQPTTACTIGFMWSDFMMHDTTLYPSSDIAAFNHGRGWVYGKELTQHLLKAQSSRYVHLRCIIRGHQHYGNMLKQLIKNQGLVSLWNNVVYTVLSAPLSGSIFPYSSYTVLTMAPKYEHWTIKPHLA